MRDPLIGRDVLLGAACGVLWATLLLLQLKLSAQHSRPVLRVPALASLVSPATFGSVFLLAVLSALLTSFGGLAFLVALRLIVRRTLPAAILLVTLLVPVFATAMSPVEIGLHVIVSALGVTVLLRIGLVAHVATLILVDLLTWMPLTLDGDAWYFGQSTIVLLAIAALATYGFFTALGGRPAFGVLEKGE